MVPPTTVDQFTAANHRMGAEPLAGGDGGDGDAPTETAGSRTVRLIRESWQVVAPCHEEFTKRFYGRLFSYAPAIRELFPATMQVQRNRLLRALVHIVQTIDRPGELGPFLSQLARDHRKFGVVGAHYEVFGRALLGTVEEFAQDAWTPAVAQAWHDAYGVVSGAMRQAAELAQDPVSWSARVVEHRRLSWDLAVIQVQPSEPVPYVAGQYVSVEIPQRPRLWRYLSPANAPREDATMEFHVRAVPGGSASRAMVAHSQAGDTWRIGPPMGQMTLDPEARSDLLMVAGGTGVAPIRAMCEQLDAWGVRRTTSVFFGGRTTEDLYALDMLRWIAAGTLWLTVTAVVEQDPLAVDAKHGTLADVVTSQGAWPEHDVMVCGSPAMIRATVSQMLVAGTPLSRICYDPFTVD